jgi:hypothetical protein
MEILEATKKLEQIDENVMEKLSLDKDGNILINGKPVNNTNLEYSEFVI